MHACRILEALQGPCLKWALGHDVSAAMSFLEKPHAPSSHAPASLTCHKLPSSTLPPRSFRAHGGLLQARRVQFDPIPARFGRPGIPLASRPVVHVIGRAKITYNGMLKGRRQLGICEMKPIDCTVCILHTVQSIGFVLYNASWRRDFSIPLYGIPVRPCR